MPPVFPTDATTSPTASGVRKSNAVPRLPKARVMPPPGLETIPRARCGWPIWQTRRVISPEPTDGATRAARFRPDRIGALPTPPRPAEKFHPRTIALSPTVPRTLAAT